MRTVEKLIASDRNKKLGNHRVEFNTGEEGRYKSYYYFSTEIARENLDTGTFWVDDSYGTVSTSRACGAYRHQLSAKGCKYIHTTFV